MADPFAASIRPSGPAPAKIMIVGDFPGPADITNGTALSDYAGAEFGKMLSEAGILRSTCYVTSFLHQRPHGGDIGVFIAMKKSDVTKNHVPVRDKQVLPFVRDCLARLTREIELVRPNVIIALGNAAMWALTGKWGVTSWRGSLLPCDLSPALPYTVKVIPVYSPAMIFRQWDMRQVTVQDLRRVKKQSLTNEINPRKYSVILSPDYSTTISVLKQLLNSLNQTKTPLRLACDLETVAGHIEICGLAWSKEDAIAISFIDEKHPEGLFSLEEETEIVWFLLQVLCHPMCYVVGQNFHYDAQYTLRHWGFVPNLCFDTMIGQHSAFSSMQKSLDFLASMYCEDYTYWKDELHGTDAVRQLYNGKDDCNTFEVSVALEQTLASMGLTEVNAFQQALWWPVLKTMARGIRADIELKGKFAVTLLDEIMERQNWLVSVFEREINIKSPKMMDLFYQELRQPVNLNRKTGNPSCDDEALRAIREHQPLLRPVTDRIMELRSLGVFLSTFVQAPLDIDSRIRCSFNIAGTETYRFSSRKNAFGSGLNLQNIPKGGEVGDGLSLPNIRELFLPDPGHTFFDIDLSSADLRIVVWEADEPEFKAMLKAGLDPYTEIAKEFYKDPSLKKSDPRRQTFKAFAHGTNYLGTAKGLAERLGLSVKDAEATQKWYFGKFPKIKQWQDKIKDQVLKRRMVENIFGYRTYFLGRIEGTIFNQAVAWIPQSTVGCLINRAYMNIYNNLPEVEVLLQVHDSLAGQFPSSKEAFYTKAIVEQAEIPLPYPGDPLTIGVGVKTSTKSWGDCE